MVKLWKTIRDARIILSRCSISYCLLVVLYHWHNHKFWFRSTLIKQMPAFCLRAALIQNLGNARLKYRPETDVDKVIITHKERLRLVWTNSHFIELENFDKSMCRCKIGNKHEAICLQRNCWLATRLTVMLVITWSSYSRCTKINKEKTYLASFRFTK